MNVNLKAENVIVAAPKVGGPGTRDHPEAGKKDVPVKLEQQAAGSTTPLRPQPIVIDNIQVNLRFELDKKTGIQVIQVIDAQSGELVRQIPPEELIDIAEALRELKGLLISKEF